MTFAFIQTDHTGARVGKVNRQHVTVLELCISRPWLYGCEVAIALAS